MEKVIKKEEDNGIQYQSRGPVTNMQLRGEEESVVADDEEPIIDNDEGIYQNNNQILNPGKNLVEREPEREPDQSNLEANISASVDHDKMMANHRQIHSSAMPQGVKQPAHIDYSLLNENENHMDEEAQYNISHEASLNISETNDSMLEMKKVTAIPILKNSDKFKSKISKENEEGGRERIGGPLKFSARVLSSDPYQISF